MLFLLKEKDMQHGLHFPHGTTQTRFPRVIHDISVPLVLNFTSALMSSLVVGWAQGSNLQTKKYSLVRNGLH